MKPELLEGWKAIAEFLHMPVGTIIEYRHELRKAGIVFQRRKKIEDGRVVKRVFAWSNHLQEWEMDKERKRHLVVSA